MSEKEYYSVIYYDPNVNAWKHYAERVFGFEMADSMARECSDKHKSEHVKIYKLIATVVRVATTERD